jgi:formiminotetrahydrofolate cyclodeaminase
MLQEMTIAGFLKELAARKPTPGGGSVAALSGALSAGLISMSAGFSRNEVVSQESRKLMSILAGLADRDAEAFARRDLREATEVPLQTARYSYRVLELAEDLLESCNPNVITDIGVAAKMAESAVTGALLNVKVNLVSIGDEGYARDVLREAEEFSSPECLAGTIVSRIEKHLR